MLRNKNSSQFVMSYRCKQIKSVFSAETALYIFCISPANRFSAHAHTHIYNGAFITEGISQCCPLSANSASLS